MMLSGELVSQNSIYNFTANFTNPIFSVEKNIFPEINFNSSSSFGDERLENYTYEEFTINIHPKDMYSVTLTKHELKTSILQRLADTWLPDIADSMYYNFLFPKIRQHERLLTNKFKKLFIQNVCHFLSLQNLTKISTSDSLYSFSANGLSSFSHCDGDAMVVEVRSDLSKRFNLRHTISILLNYNHSSLSVTKERTNFHPSSYSTLPHERSYTTEEYIDTPDDYEYSTSRRHYGYARSTTGRTNTFPDSTTIERSCSNMYIRNIEVTVTFEVEKEKTTIEKIFKTDFDLLEEQDKSSALTGCTFEPLKTDIKNNLSLKLREYLTLIHP